MATIPDFKYAPMFQVGKDDTEYQGNQKFTVLKDQTSTVKYESIYKDVDLNCSTS